MNRVITVATAFLLVLGAAACTAKQEEAKDVPVGEIAQAVREAYGEEYLPNLEIEPEYLELEFGLTPGMYQEVSAEMPLVGAHPDRVVIVKAAPGKADEVERCLEETRNEKINSEMQYPMNIAKTNAARVVRKGDYVAFLLVGAIDEGMQDPQSQEAADFASQQVQKAVDAFEAALS